MDSAIPEIAIIRVMEKELRSYILWGSDIDGQFGVKKKEKKQIKQKLQDDPLPEIESTRAYESEGTLRGCGRRGLSPPGPGDLGGTSVLRRGQFCKHDVSTSCAEFLPCR